MESNMVTLLFKTVNYNRNVENVFVEGRDEFRDKRLSASLRETQ